MLTYDNVKNDVEYQVDMLFEYGNALMAKYGSQPLSMLVNDGQFIDALGYLFLECSHSHNAAAMLASREVGIETTADPLRVMLAYVTDDEAFIGAMTEKAEKIASTLSLQTWSRSV